MQCCREGKKGKGESAGLQLQCWLEEEKETGDGCSIGLLAQRRGNSLAATVAVLVLEEETERRQRLQLQCWCAKKRKGRRQRLQLMCEGKRKDDDYSTVAVLARKRKTATVGALAQKEMGDKVRQSELTYFV